MSHGKKSKHKKKKHPTGNDHSEGDTKLNKPDHVKVSGRAEVNLPQDFVKSYDAASDKDNGWNRKNFLASLVTMFIVSVYTAVAAWQGCSNQALVKISQRSFEASNRPYIGVDNIAVQHDGIGSDGKPFYSPHPTPKTNRWVFSAIIKNFGTVSGTKFVSRWKIFIDGNEVPGGNFMPDKPFTMFPNQTIQMGQMAIGEPAYREIMDGKKQLEVEIFLNYDGVGGPYSECQKGHYDAPIDRFINLGVCP
jgi:hypothetical protein